MATHSSAALRCALQAAVAAARAMRGAAAATRAVGGAATVAAAGLVAAAAAGDAATAHLRALCSANPDEVALRLDIVEEVLAEQVAAATEGRPAVVSGGLRAKRNLAVHAGFGDGGAVLLGCGIDHKRKQRGGRARRSRDGAEGFTSSSTDSARTIGSTATSCGSSDDAVVGRRTGTAFFDLFSDGEESGGTSLGTQTAPEAMPAELYDLWLNNEVKKRGAGDEGVRHCESDVESYDHWLVAALWARHCGGAGVAAENANVEPLAVEDIGDGSGPPMPRPLLGSWPCPWEDACTDGDAGKDKLKQGKAQEEKEEEEHTEDGDQHGSGTGAGAGTGTGADAGTGQSRPRTSKKSKSKRLAEARDGLQKKRENHLKKMEEEEEVPEEDKEDPDKIDDVEEAKEAKEGEKGKGAGGGMKNIKQQTMYKILQKMEEKVLQDFVEGTEYTDKGHKVAKSIQALNNISPADLAARAQVFREAGASSCKRSLKHADSSTASDSDSIGHGDECSVTTCDTGNYRTTEASGPADHPQEAIAETAAAAAVAAAARDCHMDESRQPCRDELFWQAQHAQQVATSQPSRPFMFDLFKWDDEEDLKDTHIARLEYDLWLTQAHFQRCLNYHEEEAGSLQKVKGVQLAVAAEQDGGVRRGGHQGKQEQEQRKGLAKGAIGVGQKKKHNQGQEQEQRQGLAQRQHSLSFENSTCELQPTEQEHQEQEQKQRSKEGTTGVGQGMCYEHSFSFQALQSEEQEQEQDPEPEDKQEQQEQQEQQQRHRKKRWASGSSSNSSSCSEQEAQATGVGQWTTRGGNIQAASRPQGAETRTVQAEEQVQGQEQVQGGRAQEAEEARGQRGQGGQGRGRERASSRRAVAELETVCRKGDSGAKFDEEKCINKSLVAGARVRVFPKFKDHHDGLSAQAILDFYGKWGVLKRREEDFAGVKLDDGSIHIFELEELVPQ